MKKNISFVVITLLLFIGFKSNATTITINQFTSIQYNIHFDDGFYYGLSATTGTTTISYPDVIYINSATVNPGHVWSISCSCIPPVDYVTVNNTTPTNMSTNIYGSMTTPFIVNWFKNPLTGAITISFY